jgi:membrane protease YdiL (CAAX protease family)
MAVYFIPLTGIAVQGYFNPPAPTSLAWSESSLALQAAGYAVLGMYLIARSGLPPAVFGLTRPRFTDLVFGGILWVVMLFVLWLYATYGPTIPLWGVDRLPDQIWLPPRTVLDYSLVVVASCLNGFGEEVMVRGFFQTRLEQLTRSPVWSVVISTLLFTAYHAYYGPNGMIDVFLFGLLFGVCFRLTKRLWIVVVAHALQDLISMIQLGT